MKHPTITLVINGSERTLTLPARTMLADALRDHLRLTGTHIGCEHGVCGACTVFVNDQPVRSCITLFATCNNTSVLTIEGLHSKEAMRMKDAFKAEHALQCGFCTPGMLISAIDLVRRHPCISEQKIRESMAGNLCRCTGYAGIVKAIQRAMNVRRASIEDDAD